MVKNMKYLALLFSVFLYANASTQIFRCIDNNGKTSYSDTECTGNNKHVNTIEQDANVVTFEDKIELDEKKIKSFIYWQTNRAQ